MNHNVTRRFAAERQVATGTVQVNEWERAREAVADPSVVIGYRVEGGADPQGRPMITLQLTGAVELVCQRSLHPMSFQLGRRTPILLAANQQEADLWDREVEDAEVVVADQPVDLATLLEDELLLSLPYAPLCDDPRCAETLERVNEAEGLEASPMAAKAANPFSVLKGGKISKQTH